MASMIRGRNVDVGNNLVHHRAALDHRGTLHEHRNSTGSFIRHAFVDQPMLTEHVAIVAHVDDQCLIVDAHLFQLLHHGANAVVDRPEGFAVALVERLDAVAGVQWKIHAVPTIPLVEQPPRPVEEIRGSAIRSIAGSSNGRFASVPLYFGSGVNGPCTALWDR